MRLFRAFSGMSGDRQVLASLLVYLVLRVFVEPAAILGLIVLRLVW